MWDAGTEMKRGASPETGKAVWGTHTHKRQQYPPSAPPNSPESSTLDAVTPTERPSGRRSKVAPTAAPLPPPSPPPPTQFSQFCKPINSNKLALTASVHAHWSADIVQQTFASFPFLCSNDATGKFAEYPSKCLFSHFRELAATN